MDLKNKFRHVYDFPKEGIDFIDITTVLEDPSAFGYAIDALKNELKDVNFDKVISSEARGFVLGAPVAYAMNKGLVLVRKKGKLPYKTISASYELEYGTDVLEMNEDAVLPGEHVVIIDDLLATGGTVKANIQMAEKLGAVVEKILFLVELKDLKGREALKDYNVSSVVVM